MCSVLGSLLSTHLLLTDSSRLLGVDMSMHDYDDELLHMAHDLASRLLAAFEDTNTGLMMAVFMAHDLRAQASRIRASISCVACRGMT